MSATITKVALRRRPISRARESLYLDFYPAIRDPYSMEMKRREYLGIYIYARPRTEPEKEFKTVLFETYSLLHNHIIRKFSLRRPLLTFIKSTELQEQIIQHFVKMWVHRQLIIDEFGRESKTVQDYGNVLRPVSELLSLRSDAGTFTHGTTNFTLKTLSAEDFYGAMIGDRLRMMFNFITVKGESRRC